MAALRALAQGRPIGLANPEAGYEVICSKLRELTARDASSKPSPCVK
jgi:hypothetical protein